MTHSITYSIPPSITIKSLNTTSAGMALSLVALAALVTLVTLAPPAWGAEDEMTELRRAVQALQAQNRLLVERINKLETGKATPPLPQEVPGTASEAEELSRRVKFLEIAKIAQEDATRAIIRNAVSTLGSNINEAVALSGVVEMLASRTRDFSGTSKSALKFNTAELDFDIKLNPWAKASLIMSYTDGSGTLFQNTRNYHSGVDRLTVDSAAITIGDVQRFPFYLQAGRMTLGFGSSTGSHRADVLSIDDPLTVEGFETRREAVTLGFALPTPRPTRAAPPIIVPQVRGQLIAPAVAALGRALGYTPLPQRPLAPQPIDIAPEAPPFYGSISFYDNQDSTRRFGSNVNARLGYRKGGHCGKPYSELGNARFCPWTLDVSIDAISSIFDSRFLADQYRPFLNQFGRVGGLASTLKWTFGPMQLLGEWNGATRRAQFTDDAGVRLNIKPSAWHAALGYQLDWNPWVRAVGEQGSYLALGYSGSKDFAGATQIIGEENLRVGNLARSRWSLTYGEWVLNGLKVQLEYSRSKDYPIHAGGTGATAQSVQATLSQNW